MPGKAMFDLDDVLAQLIVDEGLKLKCYRDTVGKLTIGIGHNLTDKGISKEASIFIAREDIDEAVKELQKYHFFNELKDVKRSGALINMMFNLGGTRFSEFKNMIAALSAHDYESAAQHAIESRWATQVGNRAHRIAHDIQFGERIA